VIVLLLAISIFASITLKKKEEEEENLQKPE
jgi:hypothetical protein